MNREAVTMMRSADDEDDVLPEPQPSHQTHHGSNVVIGPGVVLQGRYEIQAVLGDGGMGRVFAARDRLKDEEVAIKVLRNELLSSAAARGRFLSEAKVSCKLAHPNIVRVFDVGVASGRYFFTMERLRGMSLRRRMQSQLATGRPFPGRRSGRDRRTIARSVAPRAPLHRPPRSQARKRLGRQQRRREADGLRHRARLPVQRTHSHRHEPRHRLLHGARAACGRQGSRLARRSICLGCVDVRVADRPGADGRRAADRESSQRHSEAGVARRHAIDVAPAR